MYKIGLIGCGNIAETYFRSQEYFNNIEIVSCADINEDLAKKCANQYNVQPLSVEDLLIDNNNSIILNLTPPQVHYAVTKKILLANKHSYCEKPLSTTFKDGQELVRLAKEKNLYLGNAPDTFLGAGGQLSRKLIDEGSIGDIKLGVINFAFPGVESFHPNPESWFVEGGGPVIDMGPYYFTTLVNLIGPVKNVRGRSAKVYDYREILRGPRKGEKIKVKIPTTFMGDIGFQNGTIIQFFLSFDIINHKRNHIELYGTKGSIIVPNPDMFGGSVHVSFSEGSEWKEHTVTDMKLGKINITEQSVRSDESSTNANYRGIGLSEMIDCIKKNKKHRCNGDLALHVLDIIESTMISAISGDKQSLRTTCEKPIYFKENEISQLMK